MSQAILSSPRIERIQIPRGRVRTLLNMQAQLHKAGIGSEWIGGEGENWLEIHGELTPEKAKDVLPEIALEEARARDGKYWVLKL